jgi:SRSO17 transposase
MNRTATPPLDDGALHRRWDYTSLFRPDFRFRRQAAWAAVYVRAPLQDRERECVAPLAGRVPHPADLAGADPTQALRNFVNQSAWDEKKVWKLYRTHMAKTFSTPHAVFVIDDTSFPKDGKHAVSPHDVGVRGHLPPAMRLHLPESWVGDPGRLDKAGVPRASRRFQTEGEIAQELLDLVRGEGLPARSSSPTPVTGSPRSLATA